MNEVREIKSVLDGLVMGAPWKFLGAAAAGAFHFVFGGEHAPLVVLLALMILDLVTGLWQAAMVGEVSSRGCRRGVMKFFVYAILMSAAALSDKVIPVRVAFSSMTAYLALTEFISIMENVAKMGFPVPTALVKALKVMQERRGPSGPGR